jgi:hypothetical protein
MSSAGNRLEHMTPDENTAMKKLVFLAGAALAGMAFPQLSIAQNRSYDGVDGGKPIQIERASNTLNSAPNASSAEKRATRKAARSRISVRPRVRTARTRRTE